MVQTFKDLLDRAFRKKNTEIAQMDGDTMIINCLDCGFTPEPGTKECFRCMVNNMSELGGSDRIILRAGKDMEISGRSGYLIRDIASMRRWSIPLDNGKGKCRKCVCSRKEVMLNLWDSFPEMEFTHAYSTLDQDGHSDGCDNCIKASIRAVEQLEEDMERLRQSLARC